MSFASLAMGNAERNPVGEPLRIAAAGPITVPPDQPVEWDMPRMSLRDALVHFVDKTGSNVTLDIRNQYAPVGPIRGVKSPQEVFATLMNAVCGEMQIHPAGTTYRGKVQRIRGLNDNEREYHLPRTRLVDLLALLSKASDRLLLGYLSTFGAPEDETLVGPIEGRMTVQEAIETILAEVPTLTYRWVEAEMLSIEPRAEVPGEEDLLARAAANELCRVRIPPKSDRMLVVASRLPVVARNVSPAIVLDRQRIEDTGADSVPEAIQHLAQTAYHRGRGYRPSGAQYAELRGMGAQFVKVLINGRPTWGTAADLIDGAFDLNAVPLSAVERIEITLDSVSLAHGADAIGGTLNLVLRDSHEAMAEARYESANGGASIYQGSIIAGLDAESSSASIVLDYSRIEPLFGAARDRWRNQDWTQHGGTDHRTPSSAPPNVRSLNGERLPGLSSSFAAVRSVAGLLGFQDAEQNRTSLLAWQSIVPEFSRASVLALSHHDIGTTSLSSELLVSQRNNLFQFGPEVISDFTLGAQHPQNPFGVPVYVSAALTGLPPVQLEVDSTWVRGVLAASGTIGPKLNYESYLLHTSDSADLIYRNQIDPLAVMEGLSDDAAVPFNIIANAPGEGSWQEFLAPRRTQSQVNGATQFSVSANGSLWHLAAGPISTALGLEGRREFAKLSPKRDRLERDVMSGYGSIRVPLIKGLTAEYGMRRDDYAGLPSEQSAWKTQYFGCHSRELWLDQTAGH